MSQHGRAMRTIMLLRHGKSSWSDPTLADLERPLAARGERANAARASSTDAGALRKLRALAS